MNEWTVLESLHTIFPLSDDERTEALPLCRDAAQELSARLKPDADPEDPRLSRAAAGVVYYRMTLRRNAQNEDVTYFKAGDVTVRRAATGDTHAAQIRDELLLPALPLLRDEQFVFRTV